MGKCAEIMSYIPSGMSWKDAALQILNSIELIQNTWKAIVGMENEKEAYNISNECAIQSEFYYYEERCLWVNGQIMTPHNYRCSKEAKHCNQGLYDSKEVKERAWYGMQNIYGISYNNGLWICPSLYFKHNAWPCATAVKPSHILSTWATVMQNMSDFVFDW